MNIPHLDEQNPFGHIDNTETKADSPHPATTSEKNLL